MFPILYWQYNVCFFNTRYQNYVFNIRCMFPKCIFVSKLKSNRNFSKLYTWSRGNPNYIDFPSVNLRQKIRIYARHDQTQIENSETYLLISLIGIMSPSSGKFWVGSNIIALGVTNKIPEISFR